MGQASSLPVIDISPLRQVGGSSAKLDVARAIEAACRDSGFFYASGHGISADLLSRLDAASREFFALPESEKLEIRMAHGGRAWRGYFPVGGELTSGKPDMKEGIYFGTELPLDHPRVRAGVPLHGANLFPAQVPELRTAVLGYLAAATATAHALMEGIALSLRLDADYFHRTYTANPTVLFRIFHYPAVPAVSESWGVGEHTDYGLLTLLAQDHLGGLQVKTARGWIEAPPIEGTLVCNIGDMLDRLTAANIARRRIARRTSAAAAGCRFRSSSIPISTPRSVRCPISRSTSPMIAIRAGTRPASTPSAARMATTS